eukprot:CAMPEP_0172841136 /NCGR_PEP_ID=MMETSP1075-20121228/29806_1 /TAXON_ID=2916 /ORGANISM="Ceratium fusus, Strain PA161109" /LENGTH=161 /DNA_ID=CAMNT_0013685081 /DNA_START=30 /DNA_END=513 /DNA_ORIENTATION=+
MTLRTCCSRVVRPSQLWLLTAAPLRPASIRIRTFAAGNDLGVNQLHIKAQEDSNVMDVYKRVGDYCKRGEVIAHLCVQMLDERGGVVGDEDELNMDGCEGLVPHFRTLAVKAEVGGEVTEVLDDDVREVEAGQVVAVIEPMARSAGFQDTAMQVADGAAAA